MTTQVKQGPLLSPNVTASDARELAALARHHALHDVACEAERRAEAAQAAMARVPEGSEDHQALWRRWDALCRVASDLRTAPGYRLDGRR